MPPAFYEFQPINLDLKTRRGSLNEQLYKSIFKSTDKHFHKIAVLRFCHCAPFIMPPDSHVLQPIYTILFVKSFQINILTT